MNRPLPLHVVPATFGGGYFINDAHGKLAAEVNDFNRDAQGIAEEIAAAVNARGVPCDCGSCRYKRGETEAVT